MGREVKRRHNKSFRDQACKLVTEQGHSVSEAARELGIPRMTLWNWLTENGERSLSSQEQERRVGEDPAAMRIRIRELSKRVHQKEMEKQILKSSSLLCSGEPAMRFVFIAEQKRLEESMTTTACRELQVSRSGYYAWQRRHATSAEPSGAAQTSSRAHRAGEAQLPSLASALWGTQNHGGRCRRGIAVCLNTVAKIMRECDLAARRRRRFVPRTTDSSHNCRCAPNRSRTAVRMIEQINKIWLGDITYIPSEQGWLFLATLMYLCSRYIVGWAMSDRINAELTCSALNMARSRPRRPSQLRSAT